ncbi:MAG: metal ABC transporter ATP-binding protein [Thermoanaerobaculia bacterium]
MKSEPGGPAPAPPAASGPPPVEVHDMTVAYHRKPVLWDIDLEVPEGKLVGVIGPNGAGKSTLLKAILGLVPTASGRVEIYGKRYSERRQLVGYVPQRESVDWDFPVSALDVVLMGLYGRLGWFRRPRAPERQRALECLAMVGMADLARRQINQLSGGQKQRVFLARALAQDARIYFMDEPMAGVDAATEEAVIALLRNLRSQGKTVVVVQHDLSTVPVYFDHVILLNMRLVAAGPTAQVFTADNLRKTYGGRLTILEEAAQAVERAYVPRTGPEEPPPPAAGVGA